VIASCLFLWLVCYWLPLHWSLVYYFAPGRGRVLWCTCLSVCLSASVCLLAYLNRHVSKLHNIFCTCYTGPWLGLPLTILEYVMYLRFCGWRRVSHNGPYGAWCWQYQHEGRSWYQVVINFHRTQWQQTAQWGKVQFDAGVLPDWKNRNAD